MRKELPPLISLSSPKICASEKVEDVSRMAQSWDDSDSRCLFLFLLLVTHDAKRSWMCDQIKKREKGKAFQSRHRVRLRYFLESRLGATRMPFTLSLSRSDHWPAITIPLSRSGLRPVRERDTHVRVHTDWTVISSFLLSFYVRDGPILCVHVHVCER